MASARSGPCDLAHVLRTGVALWRRVGTGPVQRRTGGRAPRRELGPAKSNAPRKGGGLVNDWNLVTREVVIF